MIIYKFMIKKVEEDWFYFDDKIDLDTSSEELKEFFLNFKYDKPMLLEFPEDNVFVFLFNDAVLCEFFKQGYTCGANREKMLKEHNE